jgi:hypothetical protein
MKRLGDLGMEGIGGMNGHEFDRECKLNCVKGR